MPASSRRRRIDRRRSEGDGLSGSRRPVSGRSSMNVCMVGYGMMGVWHSDALAAEDVRLHTLVGRRPEPTRAFAERYGYGHWTVDLDEALADPEIDVVVIASPSESHRSEEHTSELPSLMRISYAVF